MVSRGKLIVIASAAVLLCAGVWGYLGLANRSAFVAQLPEGVTGEFLLRFDHMDDPPGAEEILFNVENDGRPCVLAGSTIIRMSNTTDQTPERIKVPGLEDVSDFAWMYDGVILLIKEDALGEIGAKGFRQLQTLPTAGMRVEPAARGLCYLFGGDTTNQARNLYLYRRGGERLHLVQTDQRINDVRGDGETTYVAIGTAVYKLEQGSKMRCCYAAADTIISIALGPSSSLFFSTEKEVGFVTDEGKRVIFLQGMGAQLRIYADNLFLYFPRLGIMKCFPVSVLLETAARTQI